MLVKKDSKVSVPTVIQSSSSQTLDEDRDLNGPGKYFNNSLPVRSSYFDVIVIPLRLQFLSTRQQSAFELPNRIIKIKLMKSNSRNQLERNQQHPSHRWAYLTTHSTLDNLQDIVTVRNPSLHVIITNVFKQLRRLEPMMDQ